MLSTLSDEVDALVPHEQSVRLAKESDCCVSHVKRVSTRSDDNVEKDTVTLSAGMEQKAPRSVS